MLTYLAHMAREKALVSMRALIRRINRRVGPEGGRLRKTRGTNAACVVGDYFLVDTRRNIIIHQRVDIEALGRELGVMAEWEELIAD